MPGTETTNQLLLETPDRGPLLDTNTIKSYRQYREIVSKGLNYISRTRSERFKRCGDTKFIYECVDCGHKIVKNFRCEVRTCPECAKKNAVKLYKDLIKFIKSLGLINSRGSYRRFRHITLTCPVTNIYNDTHRTFKRIEKFRQALYKKFGESKGNKWGAVLGFEFGPKNQMAHFHILAYCGYIPKKELDKFWRLGHTWIEDCQAKGDIEDNLYNVCCYVSGVKSRGQVKLPAPVLVDIEKAIYKRRRIKTWGCFYNRIGKRFKPEHKSQDCPECQGPTLLSMINEAGVFYSLESYSMCISGFFDYMFKYNNKSPGGL